MGRVYLGRSAGGRTVAVKIVHPHLALDEEFRARFRREVAAARRVGGAWTAPVLDADPEAAIPWVATAYAAGPSLTVAIADGGALPAATVRALGAGLAEALAAVHELGLVHRDVKPSNVLVTSEDHVYLTDFGLTKRAGSASGFTGAQQMLGTIDYVAPEQIEGGESDARGDVYGLACVLYETLTGSTPFAGQGGGMAKMWAHLNAEPPSVREQRPDVPEALDDAIRHGLAKRPDDRPSAAAFGAAVLTAVGRMP
jgi:serine/threonine protein kinase